jgi:hypothetical protein
LVKRVAARYLLPVWFGLFALWFFNAIVGEGNAGIDARIYWRGAAAWVAGGDPWSAVYVLPNGDPAHFAGLPPTVLAFAPATLLSEQVFTVLFTAVCFGAGAFVVWRLRLAWWWILFPPFIHGASSGNPGIVVVALLLVPGTVASALAPALKVFAVLPLAGELHLRPIVVFVIACGVSVLFFPHLWVGWVTNSLDLSSRLVKEANGGVGATANALLIPPTVAALALIARLDLRAAGWLVVPAIWPSAQYHYAVNALPVITIPSAILFSVPIPGLPAIAVVLYALLLARQRFAKGERKRPRPEEVPLSGGTGGANDGAAPSAG